MSITEKEGKTVITMSFLWRCGAMLLLGLVMAQTSLLFTWGIWITAEVQAMKTDIAVIKSKQHGLATQAGINTKKVLTAVQSQNQEAN